MTLLSPGGDPDEVMISDLDLRPALEAVLMVVDEPVDTVTLAQVLRRPEADVAAACAQLAAEYTEQGRGFELRKVAGGWRFYSARSTPTSSSASCSTASRPG